MCFDLVMILSGIRQTILPHTVSYTVSPIRARNASVRYSAGALWGDVFQRQTLGDRDTRVNVPYCRPQWLEYRPLPDR